MSLQPFNLFFVILFFKTRKVIIMHVLILGGNTHINAHNNHPKFPVWGIWMAHSLKKNARDEQDGTTTVSSQQEV